MPKRQRLTITGVVQGVGFRPFVFALARGCGLVGLVGNDDSGVFVEVEGNTAVLTTFRERLIAEAPPLAHIETIQVADLPLVGESAFRIVPSERHTAVHTLLSPDICICDDCLRELRDPQDRRYRYPFINCTNCGPRFTIIQDVPYDRPLTTMARFPLCPTCQSEYDDPTNRRFHAQPNACPVCGPQAWLANQQGEKLEIAEVWAEMAMRLAQGQIVAVKGLGGFHLACDAGSDTAVDTLRQRKNRPAKPLALMVRDLPTVRHIAQLTPDEEALLTSRARPILLLQKRENAPLAAAIAPGQNVIGVMLPYTPLHYLLLDAVQAAGQLPALVMTSGNRAHEPIITHNETALRHLAPLVNLFLLHNRDIYQPCDDAVVRSWRGQTLPIRRSRGYAPFPVPLPASGTKRPPVLAVGGELKATFCLTTGRHAFMSQHVGDMANLETLAAFEQAVAHFEHIFRTTAVVLAADKHPTYLSRHWAEQQATAREIPLVLVQHHHAHIASVMAEHGLDGTEPVLGFCFDGTGYGDDGTVWGGEVLLADYHGYERLSHLATVPLVGGDTAVRRPYRLALAHLQAAGLAWDERYPAVQAASDVEQKIVRQALNSVPTSSMGRLFDAVAALIGVCQTVSYEGQAAMALEALVAGRFGVGPYDGYLFALDESAKTFSAAPVLAQLTTDLTRGVPLPIMAGRFHTAVAQLVADLAQKLRRQTGVKQVALTGGVWQNVTLLSYTVDRLTAVGFDHILTHRLVPPNDGGIALGQAVIAMNKKC